jgi:hypothetical protein
MIRLSSRMPRTLWHMYSPVKSISNFSSFLPDYRGLDVIFTNETLPIMNGRFTLTQRCTSNMETTVGRGTVFAHAALYS